MLEYTEGKVFERISSQHSRFAIGEYENCIFKQCDFSSSDLSTIKFIECHFLDCNLSMAKLSNTAFQEIKFKDSKLLGLHFENCREFGLSFSFENCNLNNSVFYQTKIKKTIFKDCQLCEADFSECDLTGAVFDNCDLLRATFDRTIIERADLRSAFNYAIDPEANRIKKARFSIPGVIGLLNKYNIEIDRGN